MNIGGEMNWVYAVVTAFSADSQEQWKYASVHAPGGESSLCCPVCLASREDFSLLKLGKK